jgi:alginate O-acetyltransferase complex protein AlgI
MSFISIFYGLFLPSVLGIYWSLAEEKFRLWTLLIASLVFLCVFASSIHTATLSTSFINFRLGLALGENTSPGEHTLDWRISNEEWQFAQADWNRRRLKILWLGVILNVLLLLGFKYLQPFFKFVFQLPASSDSFKVIAPLGISFFTFECIAYLVDVYRGAPATEEFIKLC